MPDLRIQYQDVDLDRVMDYYVKGFESPRSITHAEWFIDVAKRRVVFKLYVEDGPAVTGSIEEAG